MLYVQIKVDDDIWLSTARLRTLVQEADEEAREYLTDTIYGHVNNYYLDVARPGSHSNKVNIWKTGIFRSIVPFTQN